MNNLVLEVADEIAVLKISRPAALNALNSETLDELNEVLTEIEGRDDIKVVILTGGADKKGNEFKLYRSRGQGVWHEGICSFLQTHEYETGYHRSRKRICPGRRMRNLHGM